MINRIELLHFRAQIVLMLLILLRHQNVKDIHKMYTVY